MIDFIISVILFWPAVLLFLVFLAIWAIVRRIKSPQLFARRNYETLRSYQSQISHFSKKINSSHEDIRAKLRYAQEASECYESLYAFCSQSTSGKTWFASACSFPKSQVDKSISDYTSLLSDLQQFRVDFFPVVSEDDTVQAEWSVLSCDHDSRDQLIRQKRSIRTVPIWIDRSKRRGYFLSGDANSVYSVSLFFCDCPDHEARVLPCKHMYRLFYELQVGSESAPFPAEISHFSEFSNDEMASYIRTIRTLCLRKNRPLTTFRHPHISRAIEIGLLLQTGHVDYASLLSGRTKDEILASLRKFGISDCYPSWTKFRLIDYIIENHQQYLAEEYKEFVSVSIPPGIEQWSKSVDAVIDSRFSADSDSLREWDRRFDEFL